MILVAPAVNYRTVALVSKVANLTRPPDRSGTGPIASLDIRFAPNSTILTDLMKSPAELGRKKFVGFETILLNLPERGLRRFVPVAFTGAIGRNSDDSCGWQAFFSRSSLSGIP
jgi:hypothetical protein